MKTVSYLFASILMSLSLSVNAQNKAFTKVMENGIEQLNNSKSIEDFQNVANLFDRIGEKEKGEWLPQYFSGLAYIYMNFQDSLSLDEKDRILAKAMERAEKADELNPNNAEIMVLKGYVNMGKLSADPGSRGQALSPVVMQQFGKAMELDPQNPRALIMMARMEYGMSQFFNSGTEKACSLAQAAAQMFEKNGEEKGINPSWGKGIANQMVKNCEKSSQK